MVSVASGAHRMGSIRLDDLNWQRGGYKPWAAYGQSKLANLLFTLELERRLTEAGSPVRALAAHPGYAATNLQGHTGNAFQHALMAVTNRLLAQSDEMGALPTLYAATQDLPGASYVGPDGLREGRGHPTLVGRSAAASDPRVAAGAVGAVGGADGRALPARRRRARLSGGREGRPLPATQRRLRPA